MKTIKSMILLALVGLFFSSTMAQGDVVSAADFMKLVKTDKSLVIIDASKADTYKKSHIKNAINVPSGDVSQDDGVVDGLIKSPAELAELFGSKGITENSNIVVYDGGSQKYSSRVYWALKYVGAKNVKILHKDMNMFKKSRVPLTPMPTKTKAATFNATVNNAIIADLAYVKAGKATIIDVRDDAEFNGTADNSDGHLPGAIHLNYKDLLDDAEAFLPAAEMEKVVKKAGLNPDTPIAAYCRTSVRATVLYAALVNVLGYKNVKVYDGAYLEWVEKGNKLETAAGVSVTKKSSGGGGGC